MVVDYLNEKPKVASATVHLITLWTGSQTLAVKSTGAQAGPV